jgi:hypothetical protein
MSVSIDSDADDLARSLLRVGAELQHLETVNARAGAVVDATVAPPRRSGVLSASRRTVVQADGVVWAWTARYATFVHWGAPGHNVRAQPFGLTALEVSTDELAELYLQHARNTIADNL